MGHRIGVMVVALALIVSAVPLYKLIKQEYIPSNADEGEFDVFVRAPEGLSINAMDEVTRLVEGELNGLAGIKTVLASVGAGGLGGLNQVRVYVELEPHAQRVFSFGRLFRELLHGRPQAAFRGNQSQQQVAQRRNNKPQGCAIVRPIPAVVDPTPMFIL